MSGRVPLSKYKGKDPGGSPSTNKTGAEANRPSKAFGGAAGASGCAPSAFGCLPVDVPAAPGP